VLAITSGQKQKNAEKCKLNLRKIAVILIIDMRANNHPAFPVTAYPGDQNSPKVRPNSGMGMRDWFAGRALEGILSNPEELAMEAPPESIARIAYKFADAMLEERETHT
jgi:hypothetical protein